MATTKAALEALVTTKASAFLSDPSEVKTPEVSQAVTEAVELGGLTSPTAVLTDIAYHRWLSIVNPHESTTEENQKAYKFALSQVTDPTATITKSTSKAYQPPNIYL